MGHSIGAIRFSDGTIRYYEYNGTSDIVLSCRYSVVGDGWNFSLIYK